MPSSLPTLGVLITNYQARAQTEETVAAILSLHPSLSDVTQIVVVDDASDSPPSLPEDSRITLHLNATNLGYVRSVNVGMRLLRTDVVVVFDCDARPLRPFCQEISNRFAEDPKLGVLAFIQTDHTSRLRAAAEPTPTLSEFIVGPAFFSRLPPLLRQWLVPTNRPLCIHSCCMAVRTSAFMSVNGFDETFDFLDADMDFSWSVLEKGWHNAVDDRLLCFHPGGGSPQSTGKRVLRHHQNRWRLLSKHHQIKSPRLAKAALFTRHLFETLSLALLSITPFRSRFLPKLKTRVTLLQTVGTEYQTTDSSCL